MLFHLIRKLRASRAQKQFDRERALFRFFDGHRERSIDPWATWRAIRNCTSFDFTKQGFLVDQSIEPETSQCIAALCEIFGVERYDDAKKAGLTDWEIIRLYLDLSDYLEALKKNTSTGPTDSPPTAPPSSSSQASPTETTNSSSDSCLTPSGAS